MHTGCSHACMQLAPMCVCPQTAIGFAGQDERPAARGGASAEGHFDERCSRSQELNAQDNSCGNYAGMPGQRTPSSAGACCGWAAQQDSLVKQTNGSQGRVKR